MTIRAEVLRESFHDRGCTLSIGADYLMSPPLMSDFVGRHEEREIDRILLVGIDVGDETDAFGKRNRVGERLREIAIAWKLDDPQLPELKRAEGGRAVVERGLHSQHHAIEVEFVAWLVVDFQVDVMPLIAS